MVCFKIMFLSGATIDFLLYHCHLLSVQSSKFACLTLLFNTLRDISVCNLSYIPKLGVTFAIRFDIRYYVWYKVVYIGVASAVKVEMKGKDCFSLCPYKYMGGYEGKVIKNRRKLHLFLENWSKMIDEDCNMR